MKNKYKTKNMPTCKGRTIEQNNKGTMKMKEKTEKEKLKKQIKLIEKINKDLITMCFEEQPQNVGLAFLRVKSNLHKLTTNITGFNIAEFIAEFCE